MTARLSAPHSPKASDLETACQSADTRNRPRRWCKEILVRSTAVFWNDTRVLFSFERDNDSCQRRVHGWVRLNAISYLGNLRSSCQGSHVGHAWPRFISKEAVYVLFEGIFVFGNLYSFVNWVTNHSMSRTLLRGRIQRESLDGRFILVLARNEFIRDYVDLSIERTISLRCVMKLFLTNLRVDQSRQSMLLKERNVNIRMARFHCSEFR